MYKVCGECIEFNRGYLHKVKELVEQHTKTYIIEDNTEEGTDCSFSWEESYKLRPYQQKVVDAAVAEDTGVLVVPAGGGKTVMGMRIIKEIGKKELWITHTKDLLYQSWGKAKELLKVEPGIIGDGKKQLDNDVIIATVQTLARNKEIIRKLNSEIGTIVVDESHNVPSSVFVSVLNQFKTKRIYGVTATPDRKDKLEALMYSAIGKKLIEIDRSVLYDTNKLVIPELKPVYTEFQGDTIGMGDVSVDLGGDNANWQGLVAKLVTCEDRKKLVVDTIAKESEGQRSLCLVEWVEYGNEMASLLQEKLPNKRIEFIHGSVNKKDRNAINK